MAGQTRRAVRWFNKTHFSVKINSNTIMVYSTSDAYNTPTPPTLVFSSPFKKVWFNKGPLVAHIKGHQYLYIGDGLLRLRIDDTLTDVRANPNNAEVQLKGLKHDYYINELTNEFVTAEGTLINMKRLRTTRRK